MPQPRQRPDARRTTVISTERITPQMMRVVVGGDALADFDAGEFTDHYVKLQLPPAEADYGSDFNDAEIRATRPREMWPRTRTYSVRAWDAAQQQLTIDFVTHGDTGVAGPWAASAQPGDTLQLRGPGGAYTPDPNADWHLLVGDASVIPAIAASLPRIPEGVPVHVLLEVDGPEEEQPLASPGDLHLRWLHRTHGPGEDPELLLGAVQALELPRGHGHVFVHGEATAVRVVRRHLVTDRGLPTEIQSASGYWKVRRTEEGWREDKPEWKRLATEDVAQAA